MQAQPQPIASLTRTAIVRVLLSCAQTATCPDSARRCSGKCWSSGCLTGVSGRFHFGQGAINPHSVICLFQSAIALCRRGQVGDSPLAGQRLAPGQTVRFLMSNLVCKVALIFSTHHHL